MACDKANRRQFLTATVSIGVASTAGCLGGDDTDDDTNSTETPTEAEGNETNTQSETETEANETETEDGEAEATSDDGQTTDDSEGSSVGEYLADTDNFTGTIEDYTGDDDIDVMVGAEGNGPGAQAFDPAAIEISPGTLVRWVWTGEGGRHNVVHEDSEFSSGMTGAAGHTFEHEFDEPGTYLYYCESHTSINMRGAIVVTDS